ncbi:MAG: hypothetical protein KBC11_01940 [Candidatus Pacebacteria bacterium]|nr:hypothetical protein [Candidatus Paceibacterota bacterium]
MKKTNLDIIKSFLVILVIGFGVRYASAFPAPANPPANDVSGLINTTSTGQAKGGTPTDPIGITLETKGLMSGNNLAVWRTDGAKVLSGYVQINNLNPNSVATGVCSDSTGKLTSCLLTTVGGGGGFPPVSNGVAVSVSRNCATPATVYTTGETQVDSGVHVWLDANLQTKVPASWGYVQRNSDSRAWNIVPGNYSNSSKLGSEVVPC